MTAPEGLDAKQHIYRHLPSGLDESPLLARYVQSGTTVLDVGTAATGRSALALEALGATVVSIEINHLAITEFAGSDEFAASAMALATADMAQLPFADASFDTVLVAFHGFDYLVDSEVRLRAIGDLARVLRPGGHLIFNSFNTLGILATPVGVRSVASWKRRLRFVRSGELRNRRLVDNNGLALHHARSGQIIAEVERSTSLEFETMTTLAGNEHHRLLVSTLAPNQTTSSPNTDAPARSPDNSSTKVTKTAPTERSYRVPPPPETTPLPRCRKRHPQRGVTASRHPPETTPLPGRRKRHLGRGVAASRP